MRSFTALLLALIIACGAFAAVSEQGGRQRPDVEIIDEEIEGEYDDDFYGEDDVVVFDPSEQLDFDDETIDKAFDALNSVKNILLLGVDNRGKSKGGRTDTMMLLSVDIEKHTIRLVSFLRDLYVEIPGNKNNRLNSAYVFGYNKHNSSQEGFELLARTLENNFGVRPDAYVVVNLSGLVSIIDQLGGIDVDVPEKRVARVNAVIYWYNQQVLGYPESRAREGFLSHGGYQHLDGRQAEAWARYRYQEDDFQRSARQRQLVELVFDKIKSMSTSELVSFATRNLDYVETNLSFSDLIALVPSVLLMKDAEIKQLQIPLRNACQSKRISGMSVLVPDRQANVRALKEFFAN